jgi:hypothetical protein
MPTPAMMLLAAAGGGAAAPFDPLSITGCKLWLDADDAGSFTYSSGVLVSQWADLSGTNNHFVQATATNQPSRNGSQNGLTTVVFDGNDNILLAPAVEIVPQPDTVFLVCKITTRVADAHLIDSQAGVQRQLITGDANWRFYAGSSVVDSGVAGDTNWHTLTVKFNGASSLMRKDLSQIAAGNPGTHAMGQAGAAPRIGAGAGPTYTACEYAEILVYNTALSAGNTDLVEAYLKAKWATP